jgi:hypothetical protein
MRNGVYGTDDRRDMQDLYLRKSDRMFAPVPAFLFALFLSFLTLAMFLSPLPYQTFLSP